MELIDTHCHIDVKEFDGDRDQVLQRCQQLGVTRLLVPAITRAHWDPLRALCETTNGLYFSFGLHPVFLNQHIESDVDDLEKEIANSNPVAVGEIGLDFFITDLDRTKQQLLFEAQLEIAKSARLPVVLHVRKSHDQVLSTLKRIKVNGGTCHAFNGSLQQAHQYIDLGFKLGFGGMLTYERSHKLHNLAKQLSLKDIVLETDAPDMTGAEHHGQRNSPEYLPECLSMLSQLRDESPDEIARQTTDNALAIFSMQ